MSGARSILKIAYRLLGAAAQFNGNPLPYVVTLRRFLVEYGAFGGMEKNGNFELSPANLYPCLRDWTTHTPLEPVYFHQDTWAAGKLAKLKPEHHYDVGSSAMTIGILAQFFPVTMVDIRPLDLRLDNLFFREGSILALPFPDDSVASLSSLCVVEHIGLGRYGDPLDPWGSEKAIAELKRVLKPGGDLLVSVPVDAVCRVYFNAHRAFTRQYLLECFKGLELREERYIYGRELLGDYDPASGFGTGLFHLAKVSR